MSKLKSKVKRNFYYYDLKLFKEVNGKRRIIKKHESIYYKVFADLDQIQKDVLKGKESIDKLEVFTDAGDKIYILTDKVKNNEPIEFRLILCRNDALPYVESKGLLEFLTKYLPKDFSLAEVTHCVIFPKYNVMGAEYNFSGARAGAIKNYLPQVSGGLIDYVYCANKLSGDALKKLRSGETFSLFSISVKNNSDAMSQLMSHMSVFALPLKGPEELDTFEVVLKRRKSKNKKGFECPIDLDQLGDFISNNHDDIKSFKVSQGTIQNDAIDLLSDKLVRHGAVTKTVNKTISSKEAYHEIKTFFDTTIRGANKKDEEDIEDID